MFWLFQTGHLQQRKGRVKSLFSSDFRKGKFGQHEDDGARRSVMHYDGNSKGKQLVFDTLLDRLRYKAAMILGEWLSLEYIFV
jgi:hypothetical protein